MNRYVLGFMFSEDRKKVALIRKKRPEWQAGKLNGIGGHIEFNETPLETMIREFKEETGKDTTKEDWDYVCTMLNNEFECFVFRTFVPDFIGVRTITDEDISIISLPIIISPRVSNLDWLIALCLDVNPGDFPEYTIFGRVGYYPSVGRD